MLTDRFDVTDIPEGYLNLPMSMGGLDLKSPFIDLCLSHESIFHEPDFYMDAFFEEEDRDYRRAKSLFENGSHPSTGFSFEISFERMYALKEKYAGQPFFSIEEYTRYRE
jgi:hypothetical protein